MCRWSLSCTTQPTAGPIHPHPCTRPPGQREVCEQCDGLLPPRPRAAQREDVAQLPNAILGPRLGALLEGACQRRLSESHPAQLLRALLPAGVDRRLHLVHAGQGGDVQHQAGPLEQWVLLLGTLPPPGAAAGGRRPTFLTRQPQQRFGLALGSQTLGREPHAGPPPPRRALPRGVPPPEAVAAEPATGRVPDVGHHAEGLRKTKGHMQAALRCTVVASTRKGTPAAPQHGNSAGHRQGRAAHHNKEQDCHAKCPFRGEVRPPPRNGRQVQMRPAPAVPAPGRNSPLHGWFPCIHWAPAWPPRPMATRRPPAHAVLPPRESMINRAR